MKEFDDKLKQMPPMESDEGRHWCACSEGIVQTQEELERRLLEVHTLPVGVLLGALAAKDDHELKVSNLREKIKSLYIRSLSGCKQENNTSLMP